MGRGPVSGRRPRVTEAGADEGGLRWRTRAAAIVGAATAAVAEVVARLMRPWLGGGHPPASWSGPGVHISYTHLDVHWPVDR
jgi:hypothetical protein